MNYGCVRLAPLGLPRCVVGFFPRRTWVIICTHSSWIKKTPHVGVDPGKLYERTLYYYHRLDIVFFLYSADAFALLVQSIKTRNGRRLKPVYSLTKIIHSAQHRRYQHYKKSSWNYIYSELLRKTWLLICNARRGVRYPPTQVIHIQSAIKLVCDEGESIL